MGAALTVRPAVLDDQAFLEALGRRASLMWEEDRPALLAHPDANRIPAERFRAGQIYAGERDGQILGFCVLLPHADGDAELDGLFVDPDHWREGVASTLLIHAEAIASASGAAAMRASVHARASGFYLSRGFIPMGIEKTEFGLAHVMEKPLQPTGSA